MSNKPKNPPISQAFTVEFPDTAFAVEWAIGFLQKNEFAVRHVPDGRPWESPKELHARLAPYMVRNTFHQRLNHPGRPGFIGEHGPSGRLLKLKSTPALEEWLTRPLKKPRTRIYLTKSPCVSAKNSRAKRSPLMSDMTLAPLPGSFWVYVENKPGKAELHRVICNHPEQIITIGLRAPSNDFPAHSFIGTMEVFTKCFRYVEEPPSNCLGR